MSTNHTWQEFGLPADVDGHDISAARVTINGNGQRALSVQTRGRRRWRRERDRAEPDRAARWLRVAMAALGLLAATAAAVSYQAQYVLVREVKTTAGQVIAAMQAGIPDAGALVFAALGIAMALNGRRALRARAGNVLCVGISLAMNAIAAAPTPRALAVWIMPAALYALASDTLIMVIRSHAIARQQAQGERLADDGEATPLAIIGGLCLWLLRLALAPPSTIGGFRGWVVEEVHVAPGRKAAPKVGGRRALPPGDGGQGEARGPRKGRRGGGRRRGGRDWGTLSPGYQARLSSAGIDQAAYESGGDITAARGHGGAS